MTNPTQTSVNIRGAMIMAASMLAFVLNDGLMKLLFTDISIYQAVFLRGVMTVPIIGLIAVYRKQLFVRVSGHDWKIISIRVAGEVGATVLFLTALANMPLANVTAILQALPLAVTMAAALFLGEPVGWRRWTAILVGFCGVMVIVRPGLEGFSIYSLYALAAVACVTLRDVATRKLSPAAPSLLVAMMTAIGITILGFVMLPTIEWVPASQTQWFILVGAAAAIVGGYLFSIMAMRAGDISFIAPFRYTAMVWAILMGVLVFGDWPDVTTLIGTGIVVATGMYSFHRENLRTRAATA